MAYVELYKKYRPKDWNGIIGQDSAVKQIREAIKNNRVPTAYSFSGPAGTGKTSIAKVIAKTLNCPNVNEDLQPCNECSVCKNIDSDTLIGVQYFSMANNGEVDNVRRIVQDAQTKVAIKKKVIIIDEYHNLSPKGFDALLIPLEKDNMNALFIFCTTELDKIRPAVLSRTQNISLKPVKQKELAKNLIEIAKKENLPIDKNREGVYFDCGLWTMQFANIAYAKGYDTNIIGGFIREKVAELFELEENLIPVMLIALGKKEKDARPTVRMKAENLVRFE